jgi:hypothetical protein
MLIRARCTYALVRVNPTNPRFGSVCARRACKPDFVPSVTGDRRPFISDRVLPPRFLLPTRDPGPKSPCVERADPLFGIAPSGACHAAPVTSGPVGFYPTVSPVPPQRTAVCFLWRYPSGCPARALPGTVTLWSPDFPRGLYRIEPNRRPRSSSSPRMMWLRG